jgi:predicted peptidase
MKYLTILFVSIVFGIVMCAQQLLPRPLPNSTGVGFYEFRPADYNTGETYKHPVIICLSGQGEEGNDTTDLPSLLGTSIPYLVNNGATMKFTWQGATQSFVVLIPKKPKGSGAWNVSFTDAMINYAAQDNLLDMNRVFLIGYSLGGGGCWRYVGTSPDRAA